MKNIKISFSARAFIVYFIILGVLSWYIVSNALERLNDGMRQSAENVMVDVSYLFAAKIEEELNKNAESTANIDQGSVASVKNMFTQVFNKEINAKIYQIAKNNLDTNVYITDSKGIVIYDSTGKATGQDYSMWRDVRLTLEGEYGARTSFVDQAKTEDDDEKIMVVAAPITFKGDIIGVVSIVKSIQSLEGHLQTESSQLKNYALILVFIAIVLGYFLSISLTNSLEKISNYAKQLALGKQTEQPSFLDDRLDNLSNSVTNLRDQLDGKEYVENYIYSLTHELKTPITSIRGAAELLLENLPKDQQQQFIENINSSNNRMAQLVDKVLSLAKLENQTEVIEMQEFDLRSVLGRLVEERQALILNRSLTVKIQADESSVVKGDRLLIRQAVANLIDNAISFATLSSEIFIKLNAQQSNYQVSVFNQCEPIPDFALQRMYERFFSLPNKDLIKENSAVNTLKSTGLGLTFVKEIMKLHQGHIEIHNYQPEKGASGVRAQMTWQA